MHICLIERLAPTEFDNSMVFVRTPSAHHVYQANLSALLRNAFVRKVAKRFHNQ